MILLVVLMGVCLAVLLGEQVRVFRLPAEKRAQLLDRRPSGFISPSRDPRTYLRRFTAAMLMLVVIGAVIIALSALSPEQDRSRSIIETTAVVLVVLGVFVVLGLLNLKRIRENSQRR